MSVSVLHAVKLNYQNNKYICTEKKLMLLYNVAVVMSLLCLHESVSQIFSFVIHTVFVAFSNLQREVFSLEI